MIITIISQFLTKRTKFLEKLQKWAT